VTAYLLVGVFYGVSRHDGLLSYRIFLILSLNIKKIRKLVDAKLIYWTYYGVIFDAVD